jgi:hypothetical protein
MKFAVAPTGAKGFYIETLPTAHAVGYLLPPLPRLKKVK